MSLGIAFALKFGAGLHVDPGRLRIRRQFRAAWGKTETFVVHATHWDLARPRGWQHTSVWSIRNAWQHRCVYGLRLERGHQLRWEGRRLHRQRSVLAYGALRVGRVRWSAAYAVQPAQADVATHRRRCVLAYDACSSVRSRLSLPYAAPASTPHARRVEIHYGDAIERCVSHRLAYGDRLPYRHIRHVRLAYGEVKHARSRLRTPYGVLTGCRHVLRLTYALSVQVSAQHTHAYALADAYWIHARLAVAWAVLEDPRLQAVANTPELIWQERRIPILAAVLSCDEDSPLWLARIEVAGIADFAAIAIGDAITLALGAESFALIVDGKTLSRSSSTEHRAELTALSPLALLDAPIASPQRYFESEPVSARAAVTNLIGAVDWQLPDWIIPAGRLLLDATSPLAAARTIVAAIGGLIESAPDGSVVCRRRHPISIPDYANAPVAHALFDADVLSVQAQIAPMRGYNRVIVANEDGAAESAGDALEFVRDDDNPFLGTMRAYLAPTRPVVLVHTGHPATVISALGETVRSVSETVEFIEGRARTQYPVTAIRTTVWQHADLGDVTHAGHHLEAATAGYSLLRLTYTTTSIDWRVGLAVDEEVQFVLVEP